MKKLLALILIASLSLLGVEAQTTNAPGGISLSGTSGTTNRPGGITIAGASGTTNAPSGGTNTPAPYSAYGTVIANVTTAQRTNLTLANGLIVYDTTANAYYGVVNGAWMPLGSGASVASKTNLVPSGATYATFDNVSGFAYYYALSGLNTNHVYGFYVPLAGQGTSDAGITWPTNSELFNAPSFTNGVFTPTTTSVYLIGYVQNAPVLTQVYDLGTNAVQGNFGGVFEGVIAGDSVVPTSTLTGEAIQYRDRPLFAAGGYAINTISSTNTYPTGNGSTLNVMHMGTNGYADINFWTYNGYNASLIGNTAAYNAPFVIGCSDLGMAVKQYPYDLPYVELYDNRTGFNWVHYGYSAGTGHSVPGYIGGVRNPQTNMIYAAFWWSLDGSYSNQSFAIDPLSQTISNVYTAYFTSNVVTGTSKLNGVTSISLSVSNGVTSLIGNLAAPTTISVGSSPFKWTNTVSGNLQCVIGGGIVSSIAKNGTTLASGMTLTALTPIDLQTNEYVTVTYSSAPTMTWKSF